MTFTRRTFEKNLPTTGTRKKTYKIKVAH